MDNETNTVFQKPEKFETVYKPLTYEINEPHLLKNDKNRRKTDSWFLYLSSLTADLVMFDCGSNFTWTSPVMATLMSPDINVNPLGSPVTPFQESWIAALINLGAAIGPLAFGRFADTFGRKKLLTMMVLLKIISYTVLAFANNIYFFYLGRFLLGVGLGLSFAVMPMYIGEISENHNRGKHVSIMGVINCSGMLYPLIVGPLLTLKTFTLSCLIFLIIPLVGFVSFIPESPVYLVSKNKRLQAVSTLMKLRNINSESAEKEVEELINITKAENAGKSKTKDILKTRSLRRGVIICLGLCSLQHLSGIFPIMAFIGPIFKTTGSQIPTDLCVIIVSVIQLISSLFSTFIIDKWGRKPLLLSSIAGVCMSLLSLGFYFYLKEAKSQYLQSIFWLPVTSLTLYMISFSIGLAPVPAALQSEVFPSNVRSTALSIVTFFGAFTGFLVTFIFPIVMFYLGGAKCFWLFAVFTALGIIFISLVVPETKGKSVSEIQEILGKGAK